MSCIQVDPKVRPPVRDVVVELLNTSLDLSKLLWESQPTPESKGIVGDDQDMAGLPQAKHCRRRAGDKATDYS